MAEKTGTLIEPDKPNNVSDSAQWLSGQGGGVWFDIQAEGDGYRVKRFAPNGSLDCNVLFNQEENGVAFDITKPYRFEHISHCAKCRISQDGTVFVFNAITPDNQ